MEYSVARASARAGSHSISILQITLSLNSNNHYTVKSQQLLQVACFSNIFEGHVNVGWGARSTCWTVLS